jgi:hypothetical protein
MPFKLKVKCGDFPRTTSESAVGPIFYTAQTDASVANGEG